MDDGFMRRASESMIGGLQNKSETPEATSRLIRACQRRRSVFLCHSGMRDRLFCSLRSVPHVMALCIFELRLPVEAYKCNDFSRFGYPPLSRRDDELFVLSINDEVQSSAAKEFASSLRLHRPALS
jgi:hypothetical protein